MKFTVILLIFWTISLFLPIISARYFRLSDFLVLISILTLIGIQIYYNEKNHNLLKRLYDAPEDIIKKLKALENENIEERLNNFNLEMKLEGLKKNQESSSREIAKKIFEVDNKFTEKFDLLGKAVVKISKNSKKN